MADYYAYCDQDDIWMEDKIQRAVEHLSKLDEVVGEFDELLHNYQEVTKMTGRGIDKICTLLADRINKLKSQSL